MTVLAMIAMIICLLVLCLVFGEELVKRLLPSDPYNSDQDTKSPSKTSPAMRRLSAHKRRQQVGAGLQSGKASPTPNLAKSLENTFSLSLGGMQPSIASGMVSPRSSVSGPNYLSPLPTPTAGVGKRSPKTLTSRAAVVQVCCVQ